MSQELGGMSIEDYFTTLGLAPMYCLEVEDRSMMPAFPPGSILFAQRDTWDTIKNGNFVVYWDEDNQTYIRQTIMDHDHIILRSLTQGIPDKVLPCNEIK
jgi:phage repressor protein C with HTH and peptisase S24 domain